MAKKAKRTRKVLNKFAKGWETRRANAAKLGVSPHAFGEAGNEKSRREFLRVNKTESLTGHDLDSAHVLDRSTDEAPGHGEIVGGADAKLADELVKLARSKGGADKVQAKLRVIQNDARYQGQAEVEKISIEQLKAVQERMAERVVCGFLAEVNIAEQTYSGLPTDMVWSMNSLTVRHIVDALNRAGYRPNGWDNHGAAVERRDALMGKRHADVNCAQGG
jgi:hypothetical protein